MLEKWKKLASDLIRSSLNNIFSENIEFLKRLESIDINSSITRTNKNISGDITSNLSFKLAKLAKTSPNNIAIKIKSQFENLSNNEKNFLEGKKVWSKVEIAGNGFINLWLNPQIKTH